LSDTENKLPETKTEEEIWSEWLDFNQASITSATPELG
jgi:hypothetical protein